MTITRSAEEDVFTAESPEEADWESYLWGEDWWAYAAFVKFIANDDIDDAVHDDDSDFDDDDDKDEGDDNGAVHDDDDDDNNDGVQVKRLLLCIGRSDGAPVQGGECHLSWWQVIIIIIHHLTNMKTTTTYQDPIHQWELLCPNVVERRCPTWYW